MEKNEYSRPQTDAANRMGHARKGSRRILKGKPFVNEFTANMKTAQHIQLEKKKNLSVEEDRDGKLRAKVKTRRTESREFRMWERRDFSEPRGTGVARGESVPQVAVKAENIRSCYHGPVNRSRERKTGGDILKDALPACRSPARRPKADLGCGDSRMHRPEMGYLDRGLLSGEGHRGEAATRKALCPSPPAHKLHVNLSRSPPPLYLEQQKGSQESTSDSARRIHRTDLARLCCCPREDPHPSALVLPSLRNFTVLLVEML